jgi:ribosomal protein L7Ae-like RNA K-turn-binding protein
MARARKIDVGTAKVYAGIKKNKYVSIVLALDAEIKTREKFKRLCDAHQLQLFDFGTKEELARAIGKELTVAIAVKDIGFNNQLKELFEK